MASHDSRAPETPFPAVRTATTWRAQFACLALLLAAACNTTTVDSGSTTSAPSESKRTDTTTDIHRENNALPSLIRLQAHHTEAGNFDRDGQLEFVSTVSPPEYNRLVWGPEKNHEDAYAAWKSSGWQDAIFFTDSQGRRLSKRIVHSEGFCLHASTLVPANFNNDGIDDVAVLCHGFDAKPFPGDHSYVLLSQPDGSFLSKRLTSRTGFFHGGSVMDVNGDSHLDILALDSFDGSTVAYFGDGAGGFPKSRKLISTGIWPHAISSFDFDNDGDGDLIIGGHEYGGGDASKNLPTRIYLNNGSGRFSKGNSVTIPGVRGYESVLDFVVSGETLFVLRTNRQYRGGAIQKVDMNTMQQTGLYTRSDAPHPNRLRPVQPRNGQPTFSDLSTSRHHFDFSVGANEQVLFLN